MSERFDKIARDLFERNLDRFDQPRVPTFDRQPVHVVYGGADRFNAETPGKFGRLALASIESYAPTFAEFADAMWLKGADTLPHYTDPIRELEFKLADDPDDARERFPEAHFAWSVYRRVIQKLESDPVEDFRIDFEDGYGFRTDAEEDAHAKSAAEELSRVTEANLAFRGFRIKSFQKETYARAVRTLGIFLTEYVKRGTLTNFVVTLPKIARAEEVGTLAALLDAIESENSIASGSIGIEIMIETPEAVNNAGSLVAAGRDRVRSAHFGAFDYTASLGVAADHQHLQHDACRFARPMMQNSLAPLGVRISDSVTTDMPVPIHRGGSLSSKQNSENIKAVRGAWRKHFNNVTLALVNGFYQGWDLHPAQLPARYAALFAFFLENADAQAARLRQFVGKATKAMLTGNLFDDAASAQGLLNFFIRAASCGAMPLADITQKTDLSQEELRSASFARIMENRRS